MLCQTFSQMWSPLRELQGAWRPLSPSWKVRGDKVSGWLVLLEAVFEPRDVSDLGGGLGCSFGVTPS